ncbi:chitinase [Bacteroidia bacterium]|nr:chitinase [Bacteroidia bacterium]
MKKITFVVGLLYFACACAESKPQSPDPTPNPEDTVQTTTPKNLLANVVGYLPTWKMSTYTPQWDKLTHICVAFATIKTDGSLNLTDVNSRKSIVATAHSHNVKVLLSIGGGDGSTVFSDVILTPSKRDKLISQLTKVVADFNLDGIDFDYEVWDGGSGGASAKDLQRRTALETCYRNLRDSLGSKKLITAAVTASWDNGGWGYYNCFNNTMHQYLDYVFLMIYDQTGPWASSAVGQHADWNFYTKAIAHWLNNRALPKEKLVAGVPFYGYAFKSQNSALDADGVGYSDILKRYPNQDAHLKDNIDLVYYNGMPTIQQKAQYVVDNELGGIMIWELSQDTPDTTRSLLHTIYNVVKPQ